MASRHAADPHRPFYSTPGPFYSTHGPFYSMPFLHHFSGFFLHHRSKLRFEIFFLEEIRKSRFVASEKPNKIRSRCLQNRTPKKRANVYRFLIAVACLLQKLNLEIRAPSQCFVATYRIQLFVLGVHFGAEKPTKNISETISEFLQNLCPKCIVISTAVFKVSPSILDRLGALIWNQVGHLGSKTLPCSSLRAFLI